MDQSHKSHNVLIPYPTMHHFVTEMCTCAHISVTKWRIVGYLPDSLWELWNWSIKWIMCLAFNTCHFSSRQGQLACFDDCCIYDCITHQCRSCHGGGREWSLRNKGTISDLCDKEKHTIVTLRFIESSLCSTYVSQICLIQAKPRDRCVLKFNVTFIVNWLYSSQRSRWCKISLKSFKAHIWYTQNGSLVSTKMANIINRWIRDEYDCVAKISNEKHKAWEAKMRTNGFSSGTSFLLTAVLKWGSSLPKHDHH